MNSLESFNSLMWVEKYRPKIINDIVLPKKIKEKFENFSDKNLLFYGTAGIGKTTLAKIIAKNNPTKFINCALDSSVEELRNGILEFCQTASILQADKLKYVILDEFDGSSEKFKDAIRPVIEKFSKNVRFIGTSNYIDKFSESLLSRFVQINMNFDKEDEKELLLQFAKRLQEIAKIENVSIESNQIISIVKSCLPDFRSCINTLESFNSGFIKLDNAGNITSGIFDILFNIKLTQYQLFSEIMTNYQNKVDEVFTELSRKMPSVLNNKNLDSIIGTSAILVHKYWFESKTCSDKASALWVFCYEFSNLIKNLEFSK